MVNVHGHTDTHTQTHTRFSNHPLNPFSHVFWNISPTSIYFKNQRFCANLFGRAKASLFTIEEIWNKQPCPQPPLAPSNQLPVEHKYAQWKTNKQTKKNSNRGAITSGEATKAFICKGPELERFFFFFLMSKDTLLPGNREEARSPWDTGPLPLPPWRKEKAALIARVYFFTAVFRGRPLAICTLKIYTWQLPTLLLYIWNKNSSAAICFFLTLVLKLISLLPLKWRGLS